MYGGESVVYCLIFKCMMVEDLDWEIGVICVFWVSRVFDFVVIVDYEFFCDYFIFDIKVL